MQCISGRFKSPLKLALIILAALFTLTALRYLLGSAMLNTADSRLQNWSVQSLPEASRLQSTERLLKAALLWLPAQSPEAYSGLGKLYQWRAYNVQLSGQDAGRVAGLLSLAKNAYQQQIELEPENPYGRLNLLEVKLQLVERDSQFDKMLQALNRLQGQNSRLRWQKLELLAPYWQILAARQKAQLLSDIKWQLQTGSHYQKQITRLLQSSLMQKDFCRYTRLIQFSHPVVSKTCF